VTKRAIVVLASENGRSLMVTFDGMFWPGNGYVGMMPLLQLDDGSFVDLIGRQPVGVELWENGA
jgi:hypothetical protein